MRHVRKAALELFYLAVMVACISLVICAINKLPIFIVDANWKMFLSQDQGTNESLQRSNDDIHLRL
jgi:hypothetical protein